MKRKVYLDGELGEKYGRELTLNVDSFAEVFRLLEANYPDIGKYLIDCHEKNIGFLCEIAKKSLTTEEELLLSYPEGSMYIAPQPMGASSGMGKIFAAIAIVAVAAYAPYLLQPGGFSSIAYTSAAAQGTIISTGLGMAAGSTIGLMALGLAVNLALTGIMQIMAPDPATDTQQQDESYLFQGSGQTIVEGDPVPVLYGKLRVPGRPVSFTVQNASQSFNNVNSFSRGITTPRDTSPGEPDINQGNDRPAYDDDRLDYPTQESPRGGHSEVGTRHIRILGVD